MWMDDGPRRLGHTNGQCKILMIWNAVVTHSYDCKVEFIIEWYVSMALPFVIELYMVSMIYNLCFVVKDVRWSVWK